MKINLNSIFSVFFVFAFGFICLIPTLKVNAKEDYNLTHKIRADETLNIKTQVQYLGSVIVDRAGQQENQSSLPLDVRAKISFDQRISGGNSSSPQAIRYYDQAVASIKAGKGQTDIALRETSRIVLARMKTEDTGDHQFQIAAIGSTLRQKEYELLKNPGDPLSYSVLFDKQKVKIGDKWKLTKDQLASLLSMNRIITSSATMMLKSVENDTAKIYIYGNVKGEVDDAISEQKIKGIAQLDLNENRVSALRLSIDEERRTGQVAPGFEGKIKFDARIEPTPENILLAKDLSLIHISEPTRPY